MPSTTLPVMDAGPPVGRPTRGRREDAIRGGVLAALGLPADLYRVAVLPLWGDHYRVNVVTGDDPTSVRIRHSYFLAADGRGNIIEVTPRIARLY
jgi:hypothetical protein